MAGVNYYASTTKAAQAAQSASHKQLAWDWLSSSNDKQPLKDALKSMRYHCECTSKAAYHLVESAGSILEELKGQKTVMSEQCTLLKTIAANQVELSKLMKAKGATEGKGQSHLQVEEYQMLELRLVEREHQHQCLLEVLEWAIDLMALMALLLRPHLHSCHLFLHMWQQLRLLDVSSVISQLLLRIMSRTKAATHRARPMHLKTLLGAKLRHFKWWTTTIPSGAFPQPLTLWNRLGP